VGSVWVEGVSWGIIWTRFLKGPAVSRGSLLCLMILVFGLAGPAGGGFLQRRAGAMRVGVGLRFVVAGGA
jgi:hypothetical protein